MENESKENDIEKTSPSAGDVREFTFTESVLGRTVTVKILMPDEGIHVSVFGGDRTHIGAVSIIEPDGTRKDIEFPGHRDLAVTSGWAPALENAGFRPVVVECGIHYDNASRADIAEIMAAADLLLYRVLSFAVSHI